MHRVISSYLTTFSTENNISGLPEEEQFEQFCNYCIISGIHPDIFEVSQVTTGTNDEGIDGCAVIINDVLYTSSDDVEDLFAEKKGRQFDVLYIFIQSKRTEGFESTGIQALGSGIERVLATTAKSSLNDDVLVEFHSIHEIVVRNLSRVRNGRPRCQAYYITTGLWQDSNGLRKYIDQSLGHLRDSGTFDSVSYEPVDRDGLIKYWMQTQQPPEATFSVHGTLLPIPSIKGVQEAYLALVSASEIVDKLLSEPDGRIRPAIFEQNVRAFLGDENPINTKIAETVRDREVHDRFAVLNNGVTVVSPDVRVQSNKVSVYGFQIVNGCQTSHVLHRERAFLTDDVLVPLKIIEASDNEVVAAIIEATNSQSEVTSTQFESIKPCVRKIEAYFNAIDVTDELKLYFERRTRQFAGNAVSKSRIFNIEKMACATAAMFMDQPHNAVRYPNQPLKQRNVQEFKLFQPGHHESLYYAASAALYRLELSLGNNYIPKELQRFKWHMLMIMKHRLLGPEKISLSSSKTEKACDTILGMIRIGGKAAAQAFKDAEKIIKTVGLVSRDKLKTSHYTELVKQELKKYPAPPKSGRSKH